MQGLQEKVSPVTAPRISGDVTSHTDNTQIFHPFRPLSPSTVVGSVDVRNQTLARDKSSAEKNKGF